MRPGSAWTAASTPTLPLGGDRNLFLVFLFTTKIEKNHLLTRCEGSHLLRAHRIVLAAVSPYLRQLLAIETETNEVVTLDLPDAAQVTETLLS